MKRNATADGEENLSIQAQIAQARASSAAQKNMLAQERGESGEPLSPAHSTSSKLSYKQYSDEVHGSSLSIASQGSSVYSTVIFIILILYLRFKLF